MSTSAKRITATGDVTTGPATLRMITADVQTAGTLTLRKGGAAGDIIATIGLETGNATIPIPYAMRFPGGLHATFTTLVGGVTFWF